MQHVILDAHNIMHKDAEMKRLMDTSLVDARQVLVRIVEFLAQKRPDVLYTLVFDGTNAGVLSPCTNVIIRETKRFQEADEVIKELVRYEEKPHVVTVVSSDTEVHNFAKLSGCKVQSSEAFLREVRASMSGVKRTPEEKRLAVYDKPTHVSRAEVEMMRKLFGGTSQR
ncbi:MAG: NYN domain-containing protein [Bacteroidota bacterium]|nr:NYN domain-containing protein [Candidatus Kapabacteria bacterium]MDW8218946.1 NYN domain-containing protein [Bacteroidota bacterium]